MKVINLKNYGIIVFNTKLTTESIKKLTKHNPDALALKDEEGNEIFRITIGEEASISNYGICFNKMDNEGTALLTVAKTLNNDEIAEEYATILVKAKEVETKALEAYETLEAQLLDIATEIENPLEGGEENA